MPETPGLESPDGLPVMETIQQTSCERLHVALSAALLAACAANLALVWVWAL